MAKPAHKTKTFGRVRYYYSRGARAFSLSNPKLKVIMGHGPKVHTDCVVKCLMVLRSQVPLIGCVACSKCHTDKIIYKIWITWHMKCDRFINCLIVIISPLATTYCGTTLSTHPFSQPACSLCLSCRQNGASGFKVTMTVTIKWQWQQPVWPTVYQR